MKTIELSQGYQAMVDDDDYDKLIEYRWAAKVDRRYTSSIGHYVYGFTYLNGKGTETSMHRIIMGLVKGDKRVVDHLDSNPLNNQKENLRVCSQKDNVRRAKISKLNTSGYRGVAKGYGKNAGRWRARITVNNRKIELGDFKDIRDAAIAYNIAALCYYDQSASLNPV